MEKAAPGGRRGLCSGGNPHAATLSSDTQSESVNRDEAHGVRGSKPNPESLAQAEPHRLPEHAADTAATTHSPPAVPEAVTLRAGHAGVAGSPVPARGRQPRHRCSTSLGTLPPTSCFAAAAPAAARF